MWSDWFKKKTKLSKLTVKDVRYRTLETEFTTDFQEYSISA